jgi:hypothetical protein
MTVTLLYGGQQFDLVNVLLDTGSVGTLFASDQVLAVGLQYEADDPVQRIRVSVAQNLSSSSARFCLFIKKEA